MGISGIFLQLSIQDFEEYIMKNGVRDLERAEESEANFLSLKMFMISHYNGNMGFFIYCFLRNFYAIFDLSAKVISVSKLEILKRAFDIYNLFGTIESELSDEDGSSFVINNQWTGFSSLRWDVPLPAESLD